MRLWHVHLRVGLRARIATAALQALKKSMPTIACRVASRGWRLNCQRWLFLSALVLVKGLQLFDWGRSGASLCANARNAEWKRKWGLWIMKMARGRFCRRTALTGSCHARRSPAQLGSSNGNILWQQKWKLERPSQDIVNIYEVKKMN